MIHAGIKRGDEYQAVCGCPCPKSDIDNSKVIDCPDCIVIVSDLQNLKISPPASPVGGNNVGDFTLEIPIEERENFYSKPEFSNRVCQSVSIYSRDGKWLGCIDGITAFGIDIRVKGLSKTYKILTENIWNLLMSKMGLMENRLVSKPEPGIQATPKKRGRGHKKRKKAAM